MIEIEEGRSFYMNKVEKEKLDASLEALEKNNQDLVIVISGQEGAAKSVKARQIGFYCSQFLGSFFDRDNMKNVHNDLDTYIKACFDGKPREVHILDEGRKVLNKKRSMGREAVRFTNFLSECRNMNLVHIICIPTYHDLDQYVVRWRMTYLYKMDKYFVASKDRRSGFDLVLGEWKMFINDDDCKLKYEFFPQYPRFWLTKDRMSPYPQGEVLSSRGLLAYENQKNVNMKSKYYDDELKKKYSEEKDKALLYSIKYPRKLPNVMLADMYGESVRTIQRRKEELRFKSEVMTSVII